MKDLVPWKKRADKFRDNDNVSGMGDQVGDFDEQGYARLTGSPKQVGFIRRDETNASAMRAMGGGWWRKRKLPRNIK